MNKLENTLGLDVVVGAEPNEDPARVSVYGVHELDLLASLGDVFLINAYLVGP